MDKDRHKDLSWIAETIEQVASALKARRSGSELPVSCIIQDEIAKELSKIDELPNAIRSQSGWNILLYLYEADSSGEKRITKQLVSVSGVPATTALRHIQTLVENGYIHRSTSETDHRQSLYSITPKAIGIVENWARRRAESLAHLVSVSAQDAAR